MKILIKGCFQNIAFHLIQELVDLGFDVYGLDDIEQDEKFEKYAMVGRHASFHFQKEQDEIKNYDYEYNFTNKDVLCVWRDSKENLTYINLDDDRSIELSDEIIASWLAKLYMYSSLPNQVTINGKQENSIHFVNFV